MEDKRKENKKSAHVGRKAAGTAALLALLAGGGYFGFGIGNPNGGFLNPATQAPTQVTQEQTQAPTQVTTVQTQEVTTEEATVLEIRVQESGILYQGNTVSLAELEQALLGDYKEGKTIRLTDDHAIKSVYDEVTALLNRLQMPVETAQP